MRPERAAEIRAAEIRAAIQANPDLDDRAIGRIVGLRRWSLVRAVRQGLTPADDERPAAPPQLLAIDVPAAGDCAPRLPVIAVNPAITCANCGREGTPSPARPDWCKACAAGGDQARAAWPRPSPGAKAALALLPGAGPVGKADLRRAYLRARARDFGVLDERRA